jgi:Mg2+/Co2+ transporter CorC
LTEDERDEVDTLGGLIVTMTDRIPDVGEEVRHPAGYVFHILDADPRRIKRVWIRQRGAARKERHQPHQHQRRRANALRGTAGAAGPGGAAGRLSGQG